MASRSLSTRPAQVGGRWPLRMSRTLTRRATPCLRPAPPGVTRRVRSHRCAGMRARRCRRKSGRPAREVEDTRARSPLSPRVGVARAASSSDLCHRDRTAPSPQLGRSTGGGMTHVPPPAPVTRTLRGSHNATSIRRGSQRVRVLVPRCAVCEVLNSARSMAAAAASLHGMPICPHHVREVHQGDSSAAAKAVRRLAFQR